MSAESSGEIQLPPTLSTGFQSRYQLLECLGSGAAGTVFRATHLTLGRTVALKMLRFQPGTSTAKRFDEEARTLALLSHPRIPKLYDYGWDSQIPYLALEFIDGGSLRSMMEMSGALPHREAIDLALALLDALGYVHTQGVFHRDIKPENILLDGSGAPYLADFGLALSSFEDRTAITEVGHMVGTMRYMAPELFGSGSYSERSDLYAIGVILYELLTGRPPFTGGSVPAMIAEKLKGDLPRVRASVPSLGVELDELVARSMSRFSEDRPPSASAFAERLEQCRQALPSPRVRRVAAAPVSTALRPARPLSRGAALACGGVVAALMAIASRAPAPRPTPSPAWTVLAPVAVPLAPLHERPDVPPLKTNEARLYWREIHAWLTGRRAEPPRRTSGVRSDAGLGDFTWTLIGGGRSLKGAQLGLLLDWIYLRGDEPSGWFTLARTLETEGSAAAAERVLRHAMKLTQGAPPVSPHRWSAAACEGLVRALCLDGPFDAARWRTLEARWGLSERGLGALLSILSPVEPETCENLLVEACNGPQRHAAARLLGLHLDDRGGDRARARAIWARLAAESEPRAEVRETIFLDRLARGDVAAARSMAPEGPEASALLSAVAGEPLGAPCTVKGEMGGRARAAHLVRLLEENKLAEVEALARELARHTEVVRDRETLLVAHAALSAAGRADARAGLGRGLDGPDLSEIGWSELAGPWDAGDGPVSAALAARPEKAGAIVARAVAASRRGRHDLAHELLAKALALIGPACPLPELELEVLARPYLAGPWQPPAWTATRAPTSTRGPRYDATSRAFLDALRRGDRAEAARLAATQADVAPWAPVWKLAQPDAPVDVFTHASRYAGSTAGLRAARPSGP